MCCLLFVPSLYRHFLALLLALPPSSTHIQSSSYCLEFSYFSRCFDFLLLLLTTFTLHFKGAAFWAPSASHDTAKHSLKHRTLILLTLPTHCICSLGVFVCVCVCVWGLSNKLPPFQSTTSEQQTTVHQYFRETKLKWVRTTPESSNKVVNFYVKVSVCITVCVSVCVLGFHICTLSTLRQLQFRR